MKTIKIPITPVEVPTSVAVCPKCKSKLWVADCDEWETESGKPLEISVECDTEPDIFDPGWDRWFDGHYDMPYVDWLPVNEEVLEWFAKNYRIEK